ncbi:cadmium-containing carbonic anhydrase [Scrofimicrobium sp. R131]|uniref:Cadmium-containing carbonic anhydrase n=1 Tax=Scrofimicrobium appendicitidis TaxID=3079930 RepID=A0AAU7V9A0_9ACTO
MNLEGAVGSIGPNEYSDDPEFLMELVTGQWLTAAEGQIPALCIDGRPAHEGPFRLTPRSAGGTVGLWVAAALATPPGTELPALDEVVSGLDRAGLAIGAHRGPGTGSGCGAADGLVPILGNLLEQRGHAQHLLNLMDAGRMDATLVERVEEVAGLVTQSGTDLVEAVAAAPNAQILDLVGDHAESATVLNYRRGTTLNTPALAEAYRPAPQAFVVDAWAFPASAAALAELVPAPSERLVTALAAFNAASVLTLASPEMLLVQVD